MILYRKPQLQGDIEQETDSEDLGGNDHPGMIRDQKIDKHSPHRHLNNISQPFRYNEPHGAGVQAPVDASLQQQRVRRSRNQQDCHQRKRDIRHKVIHAREPEWLIFFGFGQARSYKSIFWLYDIRPIFQHRAITLDLPTAALKLSNV